jgi:spore coat protein SA
VKRVAVYLAPGEQFSPIYGGALAKWTHKVYPLLASEISATVYCPPTSQGYGTLQTVCVPEPRWARIGLAVLGNRDFRSLLRPLRRFLATRYQHQAGREIARSHFDVVHVHNDPAAVKPIKEQNPKSKVVLHMNNDHLVDQHRLADGTSLQAVALADSIVFCSEYLRSNAMSYVPELKQKQTGIIYNGADALSEQDFSSMKALATKSGAAKQVLFVGRLVPDKGPHVLIDAVKMLIDQGIDVSLKIVGGAGFGDSRENEYVKSLREQAQGYPTQIEFTGPISHSETKKFFLESDLFVCPSLWQDPFPLVNLEAMGFGLPVVAFARGGIPEAIGDAGVLVQELTSESLASAIRGVILNPERYQALSQSSRNRAGLRFTWDRISQDWANYLASST